MPIKIKINVGKIDKTALFKGEKGTYLDVVLWETPDSQYGDDYRVVQDLPRERRDAGEKGEILGNGKCFGDSPKPGSKKPQGEHSSRPAPAKHQPEQGGSGEIPF